MVFTYTAERTRLLSDRLLSLNLWYSLINMHYHVLEKTSCFLLSSCFDSLFHSTLTLLVLMSSVSRTFPPRENQAILFYSKCNTGAQIVKIPLQEIELHVSMIFFRCSYNFTLKYLQLNFSYCVIFSCCSLFRFMHQNHLARFKKRFFGVGRNKHFYHINQVTKLHFPFYWS